jgi:hypothetical protein
VKTFLFLPAGWLEILLLVAVKICFGGGTVDPVAIFILRLSFTAFRVVEVEVEVEVDVKVDAEEEAAAAG